MTKNYFILMLFGTISFYLKGQTFTCGDTLIDPRDSRKYATVSIGGDCWFKQNLNYGIQVTSDSSTTIHSDQFNNGIAEKYAMDNDPSYLPGYGALYEWAELMNYATTSGGQGFCPTGWHVSTDAEWTNLLSTAGATMLSASEGTGGNRIKKVGEGFGAGAGTDNVGFAAKHGGDRDGFGIFYGLGLRAIFWTSTLTSPGQAYHYTFWAEKDTIQRLILGTSTTGFSCRCVKDIGTSRMNSFDKKSKAIFYPNPAIEELTIEIDQSNISLPYSILNLWGQEMRHGILLRTINRVDISALKPGIYLIQIGNQGKQKLMISEY